MRRFLPAVRAAALAAAASIAGIAPAAAVTPVELPVATANHVVQVKDGEGIAREGARIIRRDRHRERRSERHARPRHDAQKQMHRRREAHRQERRRNDDDSYTLRRDESRTIRRDRHLNRYDRHPGPKFIRPGGSKGHYESYGYRGGRHDGYGRKSRIYKMQSYDYKSSPSNGALKDVLTAVPD